MSVEITVSWRFVPPGLPDELAEPSADLGAKSRPEAVRRMHPAPDQVLPLGSSVVAPGLALFMPA
jgi:hypothetical protein